MPDELKKVFAKNAKLKKAFNELTPDAKELIFSFLPVPSNLQPVKRVFRNVRRKFFRVKVWLIKAANLKFALVCQ